MAPGRRGRTRSQAETKRKGNSATTGYEAQLWQMADTLRGSMDAAEYKHVVLGLIFLKYISDAFEERREYLKRAVDDPANEYFLSAELPGRTESIDTMLEDPDEYLAQNIFWVPPEARWAHLKAQARQPTIGQLVDTGMAGVERDNPALTGVLPKDYARPALDKQRLGQLIDQISNIRVGDEEAQSRDLLGRVYEYFLSRFATAEGKKGGEFYTPRSVVRLLVKMLEPYQGRVYDPCCGSAGMFVQSVEFIRAHASGNGNARPGLRSAVSKAKRDISIYGQESNYTTWRLARMNLAIRGIDGQIARTATASTTTAIPTCGPTTSWRIRPSMFLTGAASSCATTSAGNMACRRRATPTSRGCSTWSHHLAPRGVAGFVLANGSMSSNQSGEGEIRKNLIEADLVDCMVALPGQLFYSTQIPACLWFLARDKRGQLSSAASSIPLVSMSGAGGKGERRFRDRSARSPVHRRPQARPHGGPHPPRAYRRRHRPNRQHLPRLALAHPLPLEGGGAGWGCQSLHRHPRLLQERVARRSPQARPRAHPRPLRWRRAAAGRQQSLSKKR